jgi:Putative peptidoglycan binding domain
MQRGRRPSGFRPPFFGPMRNGLFLFLIAVCAGSLALPQSATTPGPKTASTKTAASKKTSAKTAASSKKSTKTGAKTGAKTAAAWHPRQATPTPERYKEIQQALVTKGYLKSEPNGVWDAQSIDALRQFQTDQKLSVTGRISSASLIALGLGPNAALRTETPSAPAAAIPPTEPPAAPTPLPAPEQR